MQRRSLATLRAASCRARPGALSRSPRRFASRSLALTVAAAFHQMMNHQGMSLQPQIILLREGTDESQGKAQLVSNINACQAIAEAVRTTLGPRGMDKLIHDGQKVR